MGLKYVIFGVVLHIGYGVFTTKEFWRGDFLLDYVGNRSKPDDVSPLTNKEYVFIYTSGKEQLW